MSRNAVGKRSIWRDRRGVAALEFAIAGVTIMVLMLAIFDIGLMFLNQRGLDYGVDTAARWGVVNSSTVSASTILSQFKSEAGPFFDTSGCVAYSSAGAVPSGTKCAIVVSFSNGTTVGSVMTVSGSLVWGPTNSITGFVTTTLTSSTQLTLIN